MVEVELNDITQVEAEVQKLYQLLQQSVAQEIQHPGMQLHHLVKLKNPKVVITPLSTMNPCQISALDRVRLR